MPRHCSAGGCKSRDNRETRNAGITFHKLPKGATRRNLWITNSHRADSWDPQTDFVYFCSKHFTPESFELTGCSGIRRLKEDAFPTVFESFSTSKCKRAGTQQKQEAAAVRKSSSSGDQEKPHQNQKQSEPEPTVQRSVAAAEESLENKPVSPLEPSGVEQLPQQQSPCSPRSESRPSSPSRYMRRLPPPPGFYLSKEHSYAQLCPLLWRRRYDQAVDCLEKALRQLHAARRREYRLRSTVLRLRDKRLKHTLLASRDSCKNRGSWTLGGPQGRGTLSNQEEGETDAKFEDMGLFDDRCVEQMELGSYFLPDIKNWPEEERGCCFYCGRGQVQVGGKVALTLSKKGKHVEPTDRDMLLRIPRSVETSSCDTARNASDIQIIRLGKSVETSDSDVTLSQILLQNPGLQHAIPAGVCLPDTHEQSLQFSASQQKLMPSNGCEGESDAVDQDHHQDMQQQFWIHGTAEGRVILVPVLAEDGVQSLVKVENTEEIQTILVPGLGVKGELEHMRETSRGLSRVQTGGDEHCDITSASVERREDVREKLKEHLEGFHLQLSTEFLN
ncbi:THAP domain-containing protein 7 isoform X2 [Anabas testudineus]|uniref:THAP domain-containing protein 7 isoform X2 n=1 Tax=Anabas testudineus TaxID=64144 RepID=UPI000E465201|nr:THAP domain-containing protein 7 isoform X2 [Anabas testudineus]